MNEVVQKAPSNLAEILAVEDVIEHQLTPVQIPVQHFFSNGLYLRQVILPAGGFVTGNLHKEEHICIITKGEVSVLVDGEMIRFVAPAIFQGKPGVKRVCYVHEETIWTNVHPNPDNETDIAALEFRYIEPLPKLTAGESLWLGSQSPD